MKNSGKKAKKVKGLVVFDVEGVLLPKRRFIPFEATRRLGFLEFFQVVFFGLLYEAGLMSLEAALKRIYKFFAGYSIRELRYYYQQMPLIPGANKVFRTLHTQGWKTALISSGFPNPFIKELAAQLKADHAFGLQLETVNGKFTGKIQGTVLKKHGKKKVLQKILKNEDMSPKNCVLVADDRNNLQMFPHANLKIGYNPDFMLSAKSDHVVTGKLTKILPIITTNQPPKPNQKLSKNQLIRRTIHIIGFLVPFICIYLLHRYLVALLILLVTLIYVTSELTRIAGTNFPIFNSVTSNAAVKLEQYEFTAAPIFYALGVALPLLIFPPHIGCTSIAALTLGDGFAALLGKKLGKTTLPYNKAKHLEGSLIGFTAAFLGSLLFVNPPTAFIAAAVATLIESLPLPVSDNLTVPLITGATLTLTSTLI